MKQTKQTKQTDVKSTVFPLKVSINEKYKTVLDFYTKDYSASKLFNVLLDEAQNDKSFKFRILKKLSKLNIS